MNSRLNSLKKALNELKKFKTYFKKRKYAFVSTFSITDDKCSPDFVSSLTTISLKKFLLYSMIQEVYQYINNVRTTEYHIISKFYVLYLENIRKTR